MRGSGTKASSVRTGRPSATSTKRAIERFPFEEIQPPAFDIHLAWSLDDLLGDLGTWSATRRFINGHGANPVDQIAEELTGAWGDAAEKKSTYGPLHLRLGHVVGKREKID